MAIGITRDDQGTFIAVSGLFDAEAAIKLRDLLADQSLSTGAVIDFSKAFDISDVALAALATMGSKGTLGFRGISEHQRRLLRYLAAPYCAADQSSRR